ncbi:MAG: hypothetical protein A2782_03610 [Candidatus Blackburnbacteria bacterium RIFCSPHIGHO2_01_FULL_43_15b]|uniref:Major facilitator superfamily (MFS) profile domain-containing protein n=1 Tax=Candidatus Blackburnbacteria bacterium RIFCSPHIGHO2_01_FULL_43_15b TaxID=1797513 RepID=A0A1G1V395_9BACT|nr:MAG: hypothetical protein A2782_03610 [Candidatus Blackburnbacteria bacterium RIFCSPHIGHO2_01_FULL_43_15b]
MTSNFVLDPPTGHLADRWGQKKLYIWGLVCWGASMFIYGLGNHLVWFGIAEFVGAMGHSLQSGALDSWLLNHTSEEIAHGTLAKSGKWTHWASIPTAILGGFVGAAWGLKWPWLLAGMSSLVAAILIFWLTRHLPDEIACPGEKVSLGSMFSNLKITSGEMLSNGNLRFVIVAAFFSNLAFQPFNMFWPPILKEVQIPQFLLGTVWAGIALAAAWGSDLAQSRHLPPSRMSIALIVGGIGLPMLATTLFRYNWLLLGLFLAHEVGRGSLGPVLFTYSNRFLAAEKRSESNSIRSSVQTLGAALGLLLSGILSTYISPVAVWGLSGALLIGVSFYALLSCFPPRKE